MAETDKKKIETSSEDNKDKLLQIWAALSIGFVCIVLGVPLWWKTTEVYRVNLPYNLISELDSAEISILTEFEVVVMRGGRNFDELSKKLDGFLNNLLGLEEIGNMVDIRYKFNIRESTDKEESTLHNKYNNIRELDEQLHRAKPLSDRRSGFYSFYLLTDELAFNYHIVNGVLGVHRNAFVRPFIQDYKISCQTILDILRNVIIRMEDLNQVYLSTKEAEQMQLDKSSMRSLRSSLGYDLILTLMNPQPEVIEVEWDVEDAVEKYLRPLLNSMSPNEISVRSQYIHLVNINVQAKFDQSRSCYALPWSKLPHIINPIEPYLASHVTENPALNFVIYIPTRDQTPLKILDQSGEPSKTNSFLVPRWGGLLIKNVETPAADINNSLKFPFKYEIESREIFSIILPQLKTLLGFKRLDLNDASKESFEVLPANRKILSKWELDAWWYEHTIENIGKSSTTLNSLSQLLNHIMNIVINDDVAMQVNVAVNSMEMSLNLLRNGSLEGAYLASRQALQSSEKAFFDPSLLELLYFPEDQKFAIYVPLFLPIGIPVLNSIVQAVRYFKDKRKAKN